MTRPEPLLVQAPVKALDEDGIGVALLSTAGFAIAAVVAWINLETLRDAGNGWWLWVAVSGTAIGVGFTGYCLVRRTYRRSRGQPAATGPSSAD